MTATRQAQDLCGRDRGRTIACYDHPSGDSVTGTIVGIDHTPRYVWVWINGQYGAVMLNPHQQVHVTGAKETP